MASSRNMILPCLSGKIPSSVWKMDRKGIRTRGRETNHKTVSER